MVLNNLEWYGRLPQDVQDGIVNADTQATLDRVDTAGGLLYEIVSELGTRLTDVEIAQAVAGLLGRMHERDGGFIETQRAIALHVTTANLARFIGIRAAEPLSSVLAESPPAEAMDFATECKTIIDNAKLHEHNVGPKKARATFVHGLTATLPLPNDFSPAEEVIIVHWVLKQLRLNTSPGKEGRSRRLLLDGMYQYYVCGNKVADVVNICGLQDASWFNNGKNRLINERDLISTDDVQYIVEAVLRLRDEPQPSATTTRLIGESPDYQASVDGKIPDSGLVGYGDASTPLINLAAIPRAHTSSEERLEVKADGGQNDDLELSDLTDPFAPPEEPEDQELQDVPRLQLEEVLDSPTLNDARLRLQAALGLKGVSASILQGMLNSEAADMALKELHNTYLRPLVRTMYEDPRFFDIVSAINTDRKRFIGWYLLRFSALTHNASNEIVNDKILSVSGIRKKAISDSYADPKITLNKYESIIKQVMDILSFCAETIKSSTELSA